MQGKHPPVGPIMQQLEKLQSNEKQDPSSSSKQQSPLGKLRKKTNKVLTDFSEKTSWDWLQLFVQLLSALAIPVAIAVGTQWFSYQQSQTSQRIAHEQQQEAVLETYLNRISNLLLTDNLHASKRGDEVQTVARIWTLTALGQLDPNRKRVLLDFLFEADLIGVNNPKVTINKADNPIIVLDNADLMNIDLSGLFLVGADMHDTYLTNADLSHSLLDFDNLSIAVIAHGNFGNTSLINANLHGSDLRGANLTGANLSGADLTGALVTSAQLAEARSLKGATMPNGSIHP